MFVYACRILAVVAFGCGVYFLVTGEVPLVVVFAPVGKVTRHGNPPLYWAFVASHLMLAIAALFVARRRA